MKRPSRSIAALPTLVTLGNAFCGLLAATYLLEAALAAGQMRTGEAAGLDPALIEQHREVFFDYLIKSVWAMFIAMVFDFMDGKVARLTGAESAFGVQIDSLSDVISFGLIPALMFKALAEFEFGLRPKTALFLSSFYLFGAILRLARFNVEADSEHDDHRSFRGLPSPAAAAGVACIVFLYASSARNELTEGLIDPGLTREWIRVSFPYVVTMLGVLMWTRLPYIHFANVLLTERRQPAHFLIVLAVIGVVAWEPPVALAALMVVYALSGPAIYVWDLFTGRPTVEGESLL